LSGIVGLFDRSGARIDRQLVCALTHFLSFRGPDEREVWSEGPVGFGCALLRTTRESGVERQPACLEGRLWITADARIDCRAELEEKLAAAGHAVHSPVPDSELILSAYAAWGEQCVQHLRGDFSFAIWDARGQALFCARDHFGIKPFYYAEIGDSILFSNTLNCVRSHPAVSEELNETAVADFLLFGVNCDAASTTFRDVRRLPPAHFLKATRQGIRIARYWTLPADGRTRYRNSRDYVEHFQILLQSAVEDRLRSDSGGILLSGGLDSGAVASTARELCSRSRGSSELCAYTVSYESDSAVEETSFARQTAEFLRIPFQSIPLDRLQPFERWDDPEFGCPEPSDDPFFAGLFDQFQVIASRSRVVLSGEGADNLMHFQILPYVKELLREKELLRFWSVSTAYMRVRQFPWRGAQRKLRALAGDSSGSSQFPQWIASEFARRLDLKDRWNAIEANALESQHPLLPKAHGSLSLPHWTQMFERENPGVTHFHVEVRYPFLDLRVVEYLLSLPPFPWFYEKMLLREAMVARLPEEVRLRTKTPFGTDPLKERLLQSGHFFDENARWSPESDAFISRSALLGSAGETKSKNFCVQLRGWCLNFWLQTARRLRYNMHAEARNG
jgi:asparagine synthase (glutamine-hydrolysing)